MAKSKPTLASPEELLKTSKQGKVEPSAELTDDQLDRVTGGDGSSTPTNPTTIGSATGGAGAGKIKFNEF
jgi:hypothetical protein